MSVEGSGYTIKERIEQLGADIGGQLHSIAARLDQLDDKLDSRATRDDLRTLERRVAALELAMAGAAAVSRFQRMLIGAVGLGGLAAFAELLYTVAKG